MPRDGFVGRFLSSLWNLVTASSSYTKDIALASIAFHDVRLERYRFSRSFWG